MRMCTLKCFAVDCVNDFVVNVCRIYRTGKRPLSMSLPNPNT